MASKIKSPKAKTRCLDCKGDFTDIVAHRKKTHPNLMLRCKLCLESDIDSNSCYTTELALKFHHR